MDSDSASIEEYFSYISEGALQGLVFGLSELNIRIGIGEMSFGLLLGDARGLHIFDSLDGDSMLCSL